MGKAIAPCSSLPRETATSRVCLEKRPSWPLLAFPVHSQFLPIRAARPGFGLSTMCELLSPEGPCWARGCRVPATGLLLLSYLAYLVLGTGVFWALEGRAAQNSSRVFQRDKWELLQNFTCLDGAALDLLIRVREPACGKA